MNHYPSTRAWLAAAYFAVGVTLGVAMGALSDHSLLPVHAHINLLGWASMALFGLIGTVHPSITKRRVAAAQFCSAIPCSLANDDTDLLNGGNICRKIASLRSAGY